MKWAQYDTCAPCRIQLIVILKVTGKTFSISLRMLLQVLKQEYRVINTPPPPKGDYLRVDVSLSRPFERFSCFGKLADPIFI